MKRNSLAVVMVFMLMLVSVNVLATGTTDWTVGQGGTVSFDGFSTVMGSGLAVTSVEGVGTPSHPSVIAPIANGALTFSDSNFAGNIFGDLVWGPGAPGTLQITGSLSGGANTTLLSDSFQSLTIAPLGSTSFQVTIGQIQGMIDPSVASYFGVTQGFTASSLQLTLNASTGFPGAFTSTNMGGTINAVDANENWSLFSSLMLLLLIGSLLGMLTRARVLRVVLPA
ncbi:MAG: hypothetical protein KGM47_08390 [Acidobacteriota bacterium]|nr:hypothetical protein [Acidobacteriota bacterium]